MEGTLEEPGFYLLRSEVNAKQKGLFSSPWQGAGYPFLGQPLGLTCIHTFPITLTASSPAFQDSGLGIRRQALLLVGWYLGAMDCLGHQLCGLVQVTQLL